MVQDFVHPQYGAPFGFTQTSLKKGTGDTDSEPHPGHFDQTSWARPFF